MYIGSCRVPPPAAAVFPATPAVCRPRRLPLFCRHLHFAACRFSTVTCRVSAPAPAACSPGVHRRPPSFLIRHRMPCVGTGACRFITVTCTVPPAAFPPSAACRVLPMAPAAFFAVSSLPFVAPGVGAFPTSPTCRVPHPALCLPLFRRQQLGVCRPRSLPLFRRHLPLFARRFSDVTCRVLPTAPAAFPSSPALCCHVSAIFELK